MFPPHFDGRRFFNPGAPQARGLIDVLRWKLTSRRETSPRFIDDVEPARPPARADHLRITMVNHSTVLIQTPEANILTDPIWSERASPFSWTGPRRRRAPGVVFDNLPPIDIVLLSHNHYDHLDLPTLRRLAQRGASEFIVPLGLRPLLESNSIGPVHELDWDGLRGSIHAVPAFHFSARTPFDRNRTLWCGYMIESSEGLIYFAGDTAFGGHFEQIRAANVAPRVALVPIGAYQPRWFMSPVHMDPGEAVRACEILGAETGIAIHYGTFQLGDEAIDTPKRALAGRLIALNNGESWISTPSR